MAVEPAMNGVRLTPIRDLNILPVLLGIKHHIIDAATLFVAIIATLLGTYFIFHTLIKKAR